MPQARGAAQVLLLQTESSFRTPGAAAATKMPFTTYGVARDPRRQDNPTITSSAMPAKTDQGDPIVAGPFTSVLDLRSIGVWLKHLLGAATVGKAVTKQPTDVTGVTIHYASSTCPSGAGTLAFTASNTTLTWTPNAGSAGSAVDVGAGGDFTIAGSVAGQSITVTVEAASLPGTDESDTDITVHASLKAHVFPVNTSDRPSFLAEIGDPDITKFYRTVGGKLNTLAWDLLANDQNISGNIMAGLETVETSSWDGSPTVLTPVRACSAKGRIWNGDGAGLGTIVGATVEYNNQMTGYMTGDALEGYGYIDQGDLLVTGQLRSVFDGASAYALARAGTSTRLRMETGALVGSDLFQLVFDHSHCELIEAGPERQGKSGLYVANNWRAHDGATLPKIVLVNDVASY